MQLGDEIENDGTGPVEVDRERVKRKKAVFDPFGKETMVYEFERLARDGTVIETVWRFEWEVGDDA